MSIALLSHPVCAQHDAGEGHPERPERFKVIQDALKHYPFRSPTTFYEAPLASREQLIRAHDEAYVDWIFSIAPEEGMVGIDPDTCMNPYTLTAALHAAGALSFAVDLVMQGKANTAFCNVRPPGHHAERDKAMGFCFFNNVAVGVHHALAHYNIKRVAIIDFDVHHGNGTQNIFQHDTRVMVCSSFEHPFYPGYDEALDNEYIIGVPLSAGTGSEHFRAQVKAAWFDRLAAFKPDCIFFSAGFDAHVNDPLADLALTKADYVWLTTEIANIAAIHSQGRMISALEGGYQLEALAECVPAHVEAMASVST